MICYKVLYSKDVLLGSRVNVSALSEDDESLYLQITELFKLFST